MKSASRRKICLGSERGAILPLIAILMIVFIGFVAIAIDMNHLYVVRNELQNAADAGALAGAQALYEDVDGPGVGYEPGERVNTNANAIAKETGEKNASDAEFVEINWTSGNTGDVQRGHWSFSNYPSGPCGVSGSSCTSTCFNPLIPAGCFTPLNAEDPVAIWGVPSEHLDKMDGTYEYPLGSGLKPENVNAVRVIARRNDIEAESFFARIYGYLGFKLQAEAVAYIGFSGSLGPGEADMPILLCDTSLSNGDCNIGRMINSAKSPSDTGSTSNTAAWSSMEPEDDNSQCGRGTNKPEVSPLITRGCECAALLADPNTDPDTVCGVNDAQIGGEDWLAANGGMIQNVYDSMKSCFEYNTGGEQPWEMTLPVIRCDGGNIENCTQVVSAVTVNMIYMSDNNPTPDETPDHMTKDDAENFPDWSADSDCDFFYQLAGVTADGAPIPPYYNAALLENPVFYNSTALPNNLESTVMPYLPGEDYDASVDPWLIDERWKSVNPVDIYSKDKAQWDCFVDHFNLKNSDGNMAPLAFKSMYFMPDCEYHEPKGTTSGENFGIRAKFPVLVD